MIDIHCHILSGIDDGAADMRESVEMARLAFADGIRHIVATPHFNVNYRNYRGIVRSKTEELQAELVRLGIGLHIHPGNEVRLEDADQFYEDYRENRFCYLDDDTRRFLLIEQKWSGYNPDTENVIAFLHERGTTPIIPHPERHEFFRDKPLLLVKLIEAGAWTQVSVDSLLGKNNAQAKHFAEWLIKKGYAHTLATDAHNTHRRPNLSRGFRIAADLAGQAAADEITARMTDILSGIVGGSTANKAQ